MEYYTLGNTGLKVSRLALGTMTFGDDWGWGADEAVSRQMFDAYSDRGGNFFDTADLYTNGHAEEMLGAFIRARGSRDEAVIATKFSFNPQPGNPNAGGNGRKNIMRAVEGSLKRLGTDYIDLYFLHAWDRLTPAEEVMRTLDDLVRAGKIRYGGLSDTPAWYAAEASTIARFRGYEPVSALQLEYSLTERNIEDEFTDLATRHGAGIVVWSPLASGLLSGKYRPSESRGGESKGGESKGAGGEGRLMATAESGNPNFEKFSERNFRIVAELEAVAREVDRSMAQVAINWVTNRPGVASTLIGATKLSQLEDNLGALDFDLPPALRQRLDDVSDEPKRFPYKFFQPEMQGLIHGGTTVGDKPVGYHPDRIMGGAGINVGVEADEQG